MQENENPTLFNKSYKVNVQAAVRYRFFQQESKSFSFRCINKKKRGQRV